MNKKAIIILGLTLVFAILAFSNYETEITCFVVKNLNLEKHFVLEIDIPASYQEIMPGEELFFLTKVFKPEGACRTDVMIKYEIFDPEGNLKSFTTGTVAIEKEASFIGEIEIPEDSKKGEYRLKMTLSCPHTDTIIERSFKVVEKETERHIAKESSLFDIKVTIPDNYKAVYTGEEILANIKLVNIGTKGRIDVFLSYWITDTGENIILKNRETVAVETQANFVRNFNIPQNIKPGLYYFNAGITYADGKQALADHSFEVLEVEKKSKESYYKAGFIICLVLLIIVVVKDIFSYKKKPKTKTSKKAK